MYHHKKHQTLKRTYRLISLSREGNFLSMLHSLLYMNFKQLFVLNHLLSLALATLVLFTNGLTCVTKELRKLGKHVARKWTSSKKWWWNPNSELCTTIKKNPNFSLKYILEC